MLSMRGLRVILELWWGMCFEFEGGEIDGNVGSFSGENGLLD